MQDGVSVSLVWNVVVDDLPVVAESSVHVGESTDELTKDMPEERLGDRFSSRGHPLFEVSQVAKVTVLEKEFTLVRADGSFEVLFDVRMIHDTDDFDLPEPPPWLRLAPDVETLANTDVAVLFALD